MTAPLISVVMPLHDAERFVEASVRSILAQTVVDLELIVVDDGSTDHSAQVVAGITDDRVRLVRQPNGGEAAARNAGVALARGRYIAWQDADDVSLPYRFERLLAGFTSDEVGFTHSDLLLVDEQDRPLGYMAARNVPKEAMTRVMLREGSPFNSISMMLRREVLDGQAFADMRVGTDTDMISRFADRWNGVHVPEPLVLYRRHPGGVTNGPVDLGPMVDAFLAAHTLRDLVPEAYAGELEGSEADALAIAVVGLCLTRRGVLEHGVAALEQAAAIPSGPVVRHLVAGLGSLAARDAGSALQRLSSCPPVSSAALQALLLNYLGEACVLAGNVEDGFRAFRQADVLAPDFPEPRNNLRCLAGGPGPRFAF